MTNFIQKLIKVVRLMANKEFPEGEIVWIKLTSRTDRKEIS